MLSTPSGDAIIAEIVVNFAVIDNKCSRDPFPHWQVVLKLSQSHCLNKHKSKIVFSFYLLTEFSKISI